MMNEFETHLHLAKRAAKEGAKILLDYFGKAKVYQKSSRIMLRNYQKSSCFNGLDYRK